MIEGLRYKSLKRFIFVDSEDLEVGSIEDLVLSPDTLLPTHLVLGAGFFEEYMEILGKRPNIDELVEVELLEQQNDSVILINQSIDNMIKTDGSGMIPFPSLLLSYVMNVPANLENTDIVCEVSDYELSGDNSKFVCQIQKLNDEVLMLGYRQRIEVLIPVKYIRIGKNSVEIKLDIDYLIKEIQENIPAKMNGKSMLTIS